MIFGVELGVLEQSDTTSSDITCIGGGSFRQPDVA